MSSYGEFIDMTGDKLNALMAIASPTELDTWYQYLNKFEVPTAATKVLNKLGPIGALLGFGLASSEAGAAELAGDHEGAKKIMTLWAVDATGSSIVEVAAGAIAENLGNGAIAK